MRNFFIPGLSPGQKENLQNAAVPFCDFTDGHGAGIVVEERDLAKTLAVLASSVDEEHPTEFEGIVRVTLQQSVPAKPRVSVVAWCSSYKENFVKAIEEVLATVVGKEIVVSYRDRQPRGNHTSDGRFHLFIGVGQRANGNTPSTMWGLRLGNYTALSPQGDGQVIYEDSGFPIAELYEDRLYVLSNLAHYGESYEVAVFRRLLEEVVIEMSSTPQQKADRRRQQAEERRRRSREQYVRECAKRFEKTVEGTKRAIETGHAEVRRMQDALVKKIRETHGSERKLEQLEARRPNETEKYGQEFDKLLNVPKVLDLQAGEGVISVFTDTLFCTDPRSGKRHEIGKFRIELSTQGCSVRWFNLTRRIAAYKSDQMAPHIWSDGSACLGNTGEIFPELLGNYEYAAAAVVAIQFAESVNVDDAAGKFIDRWPEAPALEVARA